MSRKHKRVQLQRPAHPPTHAGLIEAERRAREEAAREQPTGFIRSADPATGETERLAADVPAGVTFADLQVTYVGGGP